MATSQTTLETIDDYIDDGRTLLQDTIEPYRYSDDSLIVAFNVTMLEARRLRADLFVYNSRKCGPTGVQHIIAKDGTKVELEAQFRLAILHGMVAHAIERDQEDIQDARAQSFLSIFHSILVGKGPGAPRPQEAS
jgi:hypothetical protein